MKSICCTFLLLLLNTAVAAQGVIYSRTEANQIYGEVILEIQVKTSSLVELADKAGEHIMFAIVDGSLKVLDNDRNAVYPDKIQINPEDIYKVFSTQKVRQFIAISASAFVTFELRNNSIISLTSGEYTLEYGVNCPPYCP